MRWSGERGVLVRRGFGFMMVGALSSVGYLVWGVAEVNTCRRVNIVRNCSLPLVLRRRFHLLIFRGHIGKGV